MHTKVQLCPFHITDIFNFLKVKSYNLNIRCSHFALTQLSVYCRAKHAEII